MKQIFSLCTFLLFFAFSGHAQDTGLRGKLVDTSENKAVSNAVISLLNKKDSTLVAFTRSDKSGAFSLPQVNPGKYVLLITFPKYADYSDEIEIGANGLELAKLPLTPKSLLLKEVIVRSGQAIRIKGDTTEFTADSFVVKEGATVEDLMKKLPGFSVNAKGEITAQGKRVDKVLVDGEEFFGDDPTMATQNISAKAVDKVQIFDTKSEQQQLTGMTSGNEGKTVNIKLKEDKKKGAFGKIIAGSDFDDIVDAKGLYNRFVGKKKLALYGTRSNLNTGSLNWEDRQKLGMDNDMEYDEIGGFYFSSGGNDDFSDWSLRGLPTATTGGRLFSNKWDADKKNINVSYRYNRLATENIASNLTQGLFPVITYRNRFTNSTGLNQQHAVNGKYEWKIDSLASIKFTTSGTYKMTDMFARINSEFLDKDQVYVNKAVQDRENHTTRKQNDNSLQYKQLFKKKNRQMIATLRFGIIEDDQEGMNNQTTNFRRNNNVDSISIVDQMRTFDGSSQTIGGKITFSEPITAKLNLVLDYAHNRNNSTSYRNTFNKSNTGKYEVLDKQFSNNFDMDAYSHSSMAILRFVDKKVKFSAGTGVSTVKLDLHNLDDHSKKKFDFLNLTPQASFGYAFKPQTNFNFNYRGTTRQPNINQLQPLRDNDDPLFVVEGNPDLKVAFSHNLSVFFNQYKVLKQRGIFINAGINLMDNAISNFNTVDLSKGTRISRPINVDGNYNWWSWSNWNKHGGPKKWGYGVSFNANGGRNISFLRNITNNTVQDLKNVTNYTNLELNLSLNYDFPEKYSLEFRPKIGENLSTTKSEMNAQKNSFLLYGGYVSGMIMLPGKLELSSNSNFDFRDGLAGFGVPFDLVLWNASLSRKIFKKKDGRIILEANDILNQNRGFNRNINSNFITEETFSRIGQNFLLKFEWSFNKMPGTK